MAEMLINRVLSLGLGLSNYLLPGSNIDMLLQTLTSHRMGLLLAVPPYDLRSTSKNVHGSSVAGTAIGLKTLNEGE